MRWIYKKWKMLLLTFTLILVAGAGSYAWWLYDSLNSLSKDQQHTRFPASSVATMGTKPAPEPPKWEGEERVNILLLGADTRGLQKTESPRTDSMIIASINPLTKQAQLMSVMRDAVIDIPNMGQDRANTVLQAGGPNLVMQTIGKWTGLDIQYYVYTDFEGFIALIDAMGGIEMDVEKDMDYTSKADKHQYDIHLKKGKQLLDGSSALQYVRFRHDALSDYSRTKRQREMLGAVAQKMKSAWSILTLPNLIHKMSPYVETNLTADDMIKLGMLGMQINVGPSQQLPPTELLVEKRIHNAAVLGVKSEEELRMYIRQLLKENDPATSAAPH
ncbi:LCP family protein [Paenibacillus sp. UMB4589-SE434]|uniref:LCP family protein n=1 Tax=Paenibacillus sp. UMB4589-SE434 TaxID=3046314 RepID=UPI00254BA604|nr:LCP family protein [Paenibacillus sp. UMB4589-SE434]MDK8182685.1 LCP family protein [Paenibacillus sp. UMB4589-SE434]